MKAVGRRLSTRLLRSRAPLTGKKQGAVKQTRSRAAALLKLILRLCDASQEDTESEQPFANGWWEASHLRYEDE